MKSEVQTLLQKARDSLQAAELLYREGYSDFCASRAYYSLFYTAEALLLDRELAFSSHSAVIAAFGREFAKVGILDPKYHRYLLDAQDSRNLGDYGVGPSVPDSQAREVLGWASEFILTAEQYLTGR